MLLRNNPICIIQEVKQDSFAELNFEMEESKTYKNNADDCHNAANILANEADKLEVKGESEVSKRIYKQAIKNDLEALELYGKSVIASDENEAIFKDPFGKSLSQVKVSHNLAVITRTLKSGRCELVDNEELSFLNNIFGNKEKRNGKGNEQPYNIARYHNVAGNKEKQEKLHEIVENVKEKVEETEKKSKQARKSKNEIRIGNIAFYINSNG